MSNKNFQIKNFGKHRKKDFKGNHINDIMVTLTTPLIPHLLNFTTKETLKFLEFMALASTFRPTSSLQSFASPRQNLCDFPSQLNFFYFRF
jgi:hypothetical protein